VSEPAAARDTPFAPRPAPRGAGPRGQIPADLHGRQHPGHGRPRLPRLLPRQRVVHTLPEEQCRCRECGKALVVIGEETSEQLDYKPASLFVVEHVRVKYACTACEGHLALAEMPAQPIDCAFRSIVNT
jgi:transposase